MAILAIDPGTNSAGVAYGRWSHKNRWRVWLWQLQVDRDQQRRRNDEKRMDHLARRVVNMLTKPNFEASVVEPHALLLEYSLRSKYASSALMLSAGLLGAQAMNGFGQDDTIVMVPPQRWMRKGAGYDAAVKLVEPWYSRAWLKQNNDAWCAAGILTWFTEQPQAEFYKALAAPKGDPDGASS